MRNRDHLLCLVVVVILLVLAVTPGKSRPVDPLRANPPQVKPAAKFTRTQDVIYGRRDGHALTMDVFTPTANANGAGVIICVSAGYRSDRTVLDTIFHPHTTKPFLDRGYTVFAVMHSSQPRYTVLEAVDDLHRAVRYIKANAGKYGVKADKLACAGGSSGGQLALMMGCAGCAGDKKAPDPVDRESSWVAAVGCFFPPTDFVAFEKHVRQDVKQWAQYEGAFEFRELDGASGRYRSVTADRRMELLAKLSPVTHVAPGAAPTLIIHTLGDPVVPFSQSEVMIEKFKQARVKCNLVALDGDQHFHLGVVKDIPKVADWFDHHLFDQK